MPAENPIVSVIIPTKNSMETIENCLQSIKRQSYMHTEIIVVDNHSTDKTKELAKKYTKQVFTHGPERSAQRNYGASCAHGEYFLFIDSDMEVAPTVIEDCVQKIQNNHHVKAIIIPEESFGRGFWSKCKKLERSFYKNVEWMEAGRFIEKKIFHTINGYDPYNTGTEDYDISQKIEQKIGKKAISRISSHIYHNEGKINLLTSCKKKFYYAQNLHRYYSISANTAKYKKQSSIIKRYQLFLSKPSLLLENPIISAGMILMKTCEFACGSLGHIAGYITPKNPKTNN